MQNAFTVNSCRFKQSSLSLTAIDVLMVTAANIRNPQVGDSALFLHRNLKSTTTMLQH